MSPNRFSTDNGHDVAVATLANGKSPSTNGATARTSRRKPDLANDSAPSTDGSNGAQGRTAGRVHGDMPPSTDGSNGAAAAASHQDNGQFAKGNPGGHGNPFARQTAQLRQVMIDATTPERMRAVADLLYDRTMKGDMVAAKLLLAYTIGKPAPAPEPDLLDEDELARFQAHVPMFGAMSKLMTTAGPDLSLGLVRDAKPIVTRERAVQLATLWSLPDKQQLPLLDRMKTMSNGEIATELQKLAKEMGIGQPPSTNGSNGANGAAKKR